MINLILRGGLGNQMFLYAYARLIQYHTKDTIKINLYELKKDTDGRSYALENLVLTDNLVVSDSSLRDTIDKNIYRIKTMLYRNSPEQHGIYRNNEDENHKPHIAEKCRNKYISGNFQGWRYFSEIDDIVKKELKVKTAPSEANRKMIEEISSCNSVCLHIRRGDYINNPKWSKELNICGEEYYKKAVELIKKKTENPVFFVFSNSSEDLKWIEENYNFDADLRYVDLNNPDYEELRLMYMCRHFIISNSTFSWWAQYLSDNDDKIVAAPSRWNNILDASPLYMDNWEIIDT